MNHTADRIISRMSELKVTQADIRRATGAGKATISSWIKGDTKPSGMYATKLASFLHCHTDWLISGSEATNNSYEADKLLPITEIAEAMIPVITWDTANNYNDSIIMNSIISWIPRHQHLSKQAFGLVIHGRSMYPEFKPNDIIYIEPEITSKDLRDGDFILIQDDDGKSPILKQLIIGNNQDDRYLKLINPDWATEAMVSMDTCLLVGIVDSKLVRYRN